MIAQGSLLNVNVANRGKVHLEMAWAPPHQERDFCFLKIPGSSEVGERRNSIRFLSLSLSLHLSALS